MLRLTFTPGLALTGFRTTRPRCVWSVSGLKLKVKASLLLLKFSSIKQLQVYFYFSQTWMDILAESRVKPQHLILQQQQGNTLKSTAHGLSPIWPVLKHTYMYL